MTSTAPQFPEISGYTITEQLYLGSRTAVYRAVHDNQQLPVVIKVLQREYPTFGELVQFSNQYAIAKNLPIAGIIQPLNLETFGNGYALVMPDWGGISLEKYIRQHQLDLSEQLAIALQITNILQDLHSFRVIHKDIKPANILIHPESKQVKLIDFSIASLLPKETQEIQNPNVLEGTLAYLAPEQTGRMNRGIDYRSDFYAFGVTLYQLLSGSLPFATDDPLELVHCHIAKIATFIHQVNTDVPEMVGVIIAKLMAKNAEDRYQSALGLKYDLTECLNQWKKTGSIAEFELGQRDLCDRFMIPEKLYGREVEVQTLLEAFERVTQGSSELMLIAGLSGIGKTAVVNEVHKPITRQKGYFIKGKFDQFNRNIPFSAFVQAFRSLMGQLLSESDTQLQYWKTQITAALGENVQVIVELIPELERIIGTQPPAPELSGSAAQNRFNLLFQRFIQVFTTPEHPLVIFVDDLQWADSASLNLIQVLMSESQTGCLLLLGAYRDNEVFAAHPLMLTLNEMEKTGATIHTITLQPLKHHSLNYLIAHTLHAPISVVQPLTELVMQKTRGNPFFATQFLKALHQDLLINFDQDAGHWQCDIVQVRDATLTDDVVEFMVQQLQKLPAATQEILKLAACIGAQFDLNTLAIVSQQSPTEVATTLWKALQSGLILPQSDLYKFYLSETQAIQHTPQETLNYRFLHDRVQQAAYSLIPESQKQLTHVQIGQLLLQQIPTEEKENRIFELVNQLNYGTALITQQKERDELAQLNLIACRKAKNSTAYQVGREYANIGLSLLGENAWTSQYDLTLAFHDLAVELASLCSDFETMEDLIQEVIANAHSLIEQVNVYRIKIISLVSQNKLTSTIAIAQQFLQQLGLTFPSSPTHDDAQQAIAVIDKLIADREIKDLVNLPIMKDEEKIAILQINNSIIPLVYMSIPDLFPLVVCSSLKLSIEYGNTPASAYAYSCYSIIAFNLKQDVDKGVEFGNLALQVVSKLDNKTVKPEVFNAVGFLILHRKSHIKETLPILQEGYKIALEVGNQDMAGYNAHVFCLNSFWCANSLVTLEQEIKTHCLQLVQFNQLTLANWCRIYWQSTLNLLGIAKHPSILSGEAIQETEFLTQLIEARDLLGLYFFHLYKLMLCYLLGDIESAQKQVAEAKGYLMAGAGVATFGEAIFYFYDSLSILAALSSKSPETADLLQRVEENQTRLQQKWADYAPMNHQHKVDLVEAEKCRVLGQKLEAIELYEKAIFGAKTNKYMQEEALANELAAKFYLDWGKEKIATSYMQEAYYCYARWGAKAKTDDLEKRYPQLLAPILQNQLQKLGIIQTSSPSLYKSEFINPTIQTTVASSSNIDESLDFASIIKSSQALSSKIQLEQLISQLMQVVMENAGASKAALLLQKEDTLILEALATSNQDIKLLNIPSQESENIPHTIVNLVKRNFKIVVLDDATIQNDFIADAYLIQQQPKSLLCMPILNQGKLIGLLYLENELTANAFTQKRVEILNLLITQAAISLENAQLYDKLSNYSQILEQKVEERTLQFKQKAHQLESTLKELQSTQAQLIQSEKMYALGKLVAGIAHEINNPISFIYGNLTPIEEYIESFIELFNLYQQKYPQPLPEIESKIADVDLEFIIDDLPKLLDSMKTGVQRIREIILSLRNFSRLDEAEIKSVDINSGIDSTLLILQHQLKSNHQFPEIAVIKEYSPLPEVICYASQVNQVFMNIIGNAIDALRDTQQKEPRITIRTSQLDSQNILIRIADNGTGINKLVMNKIFDPFFTTKPVGSGTGLGLSTSYSIIVEKHGGKLSCVSTPGEGTEFLIQLPLMKT